MKKISVVLPTYNGSEHIIQSIDSVLSQTYENFELIIVDDCSTDNTLDILREYEKADSRVKVIQNMQNQKLPKSLNIGFCAAEGEYWTWTSDDNYYKANAFECMANYLDEHMNVDMVYTNYTMIDDAGNDIQEINLVDVDQIAFGNNIGACFMYRKSIAQKVGEYDSSLFLAEDYDYWIRIYKEGNIHHINENLYNYRSHKNSLTASKHEQIYNQTYHLFEKHFLFLYSNIETVSERFRFLESLFLWGENLNQEEIKKTVLRIMPSYYRVKRREKMKLFFKKVLIKLNLMRSTMKS